MDNLVEGNVTISCICLCIRASGNLWICQENGVWADQGRLPETEPEALHSFTLPLLDTLDPATIRFCCTGLTHAKWTICLEPEHLCSEAGGGGALCCFPYDSHVSAKATLSPASNLKSKGSYGNWKEQGQHPMSHQHTDYAPWPSAAEGSVHGTLKGARPTCHDHTTHWPCCWPRTISSSGLSSQSPAFLAGAPSPFPPCNPLAQSLQTGQRVSFEGLTVRYFMILSAGQHWRLQSPWAPHSKQYSTPFF